MAAQIFEILWDKDDELSQSNEYFFTNIEHQEVCWEKENFQDSNEIFMKKYWKNEHERSICTNIPPNSTFKADSEKVNQDISISW